jgi:exopolysaccharide biosynthesis polyprenyl glycosylphosphotransferase
MTTATSTAETPIFTNEIGALPIPAASRQHVASSLLATLLEGRNWSRLRLLLDCLVLYLAASITLLTPTRNEGSIGHLTAAGFPLLVLGLSYIRPSPDQQLGGSTLDTVFHILGNVSLAAVLTVGGSATLGAIHPVGETTRLWLFTVVLFAGTRLALMTLRRSALRLEGIAVPTLIIGAGQVGAQLVSRLRSDRRFGLRPVGFLDSDPRLTDGLSTAGVNLPLLGGPEDLASAVASTGAQHVILAFASEPDRLLNARVKECERLGVGVSLVPRLYESISVRATLDHVGGMPLVALRPIDPKGWQFAVKHAIGRTVALLTLLMLTPVLLLIALAVRLSSPGPVLFRQRRVGRDGHEFNLLKFRSMRMPTPDELEFTPASGVAPGGVEGVDRRTPVGKLLRISSLDELPQLFNVLLGDMTIVGPRPERPEFVERFSTEIARYEDRHRVKSGITGWAQVNGLRGQTSIAARVECDNYYIQNWSLRLDLRIIALTVVEVFRFRDA